MVRISFGSYSWEYNIFWCYTAVEVMLFWEWYTMLLLFTCLLLWRLVVIQTMIKLDKKMMILHCFYYLNNLGLNFTKKMMILHCFYHLNNLGLNFTKKMMIFDLFIIWITCDSTLQKRLWYFTVFIIWITCNLFWFLDSNLLVIFFVEMFNWIMEKVTKLILVSDSKSTALKPLYSIIKL